MKFLLCFFMLGSASAFSFEVPKVAARHVNESYTDATFRFRIQNHVWDKPEENGSGTVENEAKPVDQLLLDKVPEWDGSFGTLQENFERIRDLRFVEDQSHAGKLRRSTWLYPDDGCFARASLAIENLHASTIQIPKVYVFGNLRVKTPNSLSGSVSWWFHVVPIVKIKGQPYIIDPAVNPKAPMTLNDWLTAVNEDKDPTINVSICRGDTFFPTDICWGTKKEDGDALGHQEMFLSQEWYRIEDLKRDPEKELWDAPPWLQPVAEVSITQ